MLMSWMHLRNADSLSRTAPRKKLKRTQTPHKSHPHADFNHHLHCKHPQERISTHPFFDVLIVMVLVSQSRICQHSSRMPRRQVRSVKKSAVAICVVVGVNDSAAYPECDATALRPFIREASGRQCAHDAGYSSGFSLLRAKPTETQLRAICKSRACDTLFHDMADQYAHNVAECTVPMGDKIRLRADLVSYVVDRCPEMKDVYALMDCTADDGERPESASAFWYYPESTNISYVPEALNTYPIVPGPTGVEWEGNEVVVRNDGWEIVAYIEEAGDEERIGDHAGIMEAGRAGQTVAYECARGDDHVYLQNGSGSANSSGARCRRRYVCFSE